jgi:UDP-galactopyranose mutase
VVYEKFVRGYTEKQWGVAASSLAASLAGRFEVRSNGDVRLKTHRFQGLPMAGYAQFMEAMLGGIPVFLHFDYLRCRSEVAARKLLVYTGPIDEFFSYDLGRLRYRCQRRETHYLPDVQRFQPVGQVNYPSFADGPHIRILEWTHMAPPGKQAVVSGTVITVEVPTDASRPDEYEYPFPDELNRQLYERYAERARALNNVLFCGRLGEYRYYDMDQAIARAMQYALKILGSPAARDGVR